MRSKRTRRHLPNKARAWSAAVETVKGRGGQGGGGGGGGGGASGSGHGFRAWVPGMGSGHGFRAWVPGMGSLQARVGSRHRSSRQGSRRVRWKRPRRHLLNRAWASSAAVGGRRWRRPVPGTGIGPDQVGGRGQGAAHRSRRLTGKAHGQGSRARLTGKAHGQGSRARLTGKAHGGSGEDGPRELLRGTIPGAGDALASGWRASESLGVLVETAGCARLGSVRRESPRQ